MKRTTLCLFAGVGATAKGQRDILDHEVYVVENHLSALIVGANLPAAGHE